MNKKRQEIWNKSGGKCWYCGCVLADKWHADHFEPLGRLPNAISYNYEDTEYALIRTKVETKRVPLNPERDHIDNLVPACPSCNLMKGMSSVEGFREIIYRFIESLNSYSNQYKFAKKYGLIVESQEPVVFWFERQNAG